MIAAKEWAAYQESYVKYGFDMKPKSETKKRRPTQKAAVTFSSKEKSLLLFIILITGICCLAGIFIQASTSTIKYNINSIQNESAAVRAEIEELNVQLKGQKGIDYIIDYATVELGLRHPTQDQYVYISQVTPEVENYIAQMKAEQKGIVKETKKTPASAGLRLVTDRVLS